MLVPVPATSEERRERRRTLTGNAAKKDVKKDVDGPQKSLYDVLSLEDDGSDAESAPQQLEQPEKPSSGASAETGLESQVAQVSVSDGDWKTVGK